MDGFVRENYLTDRTQLERVAYVRLSGIRLTKIVPDIIKDTHSEAKLPKSREMKGKVKMGTKAETLKKKLEEEEKAFREKQKQLKARIQLESAKERKSRDKFETHVKIIAGSIAFELSEQDSAIHKKFEQYLQGYLESRPGDWPYFEKFPNKKDGKLLFQLTAPRGWQDVVKGRQKKIGGGEEKKTGK